MRKSFILSLIALISPVALHGIARADDKPAASQPSTAPSGNSIEAIDQDGLKAAVGKTVTVHGKVSGTFKTKSGIVLINFEGANRGFTLMIPKDSVEGVAGGFDGDIDKALKDQPILATGKIELYKDRPEMKVTSPDQVKIAQK